MPTSSSFDFIIIGAGSTGCVLARRLCEDGAARVALIEAGGDPDPVLSRIPGAAPRQQGTGSDWRFYTEPQRGLYDRIIDYPQFQSIFTLSITEFYRNAGRPAHYTTLG